MSASVPRRIVEALVRPLEPERARALEARWASLPAALRTPFQVFGRKTTGCAATIGMHPRCDFACRGCYLGAEANRVPPLPVGAIEAQLREIRGWTGPKGNVQFTDGEVTLRDPAELQALLRYARAIDLVPMLMTHGDSFRRRPGLLESLLVEGELEAISLHIDTTQRGRVGFQHPKDERALDPLREEFAALIRTARRTTGRSIRVAATMTVTRENLSQVGATVAWCARNRDVFRMVSLQPVADVGRTETSLQPVAVDDVWVDVGRALAPFTGTPHLEFPITMGHPACNRFASFLTLTWKSRPHADVFLPALRANEPRDAALAQRLSCLPLTGVAYRDRHRTARLARIASVVLRSLPFLLGTALPYIARRLADRGLSPSSVLGDALRGDVEFGGFQVVSHHFMSRDEITTLRGRERLQACVFRVPVDGRMVSMCEVNLLGLRDHVYARAAAGAPPPSRGHATRLPTLAR